MCAVPVTAGDGDALKGHHEDALPFGGQRLELVQDVKALGHAAAARREGEGERGVSGVSGVSGVDKVQSKEKEGWEAGGKRSQWSR